MAGMMVFEVKDGYIKETRKCSKSYFMLQLNNQVPQK